MQYFPAGNTLCERVGVISVDIVDIVCACVSNISGLLNKQTLHLLLFSKYPCEAICDRHRANQNFAFKSGLLLTEVQGSD